MTKKWSEKKWSEMTSADKGKFFAVCIYGLIALGFCILDLTGKWKNEVCMYMLSAYFLFDGVMDWKKNRKMAISSICLAIILLVTTF